MAQKQNQPSHPVFSAQSLRTLRLCGLIVFVDQCTAEAQSTQRKVGCFYIVVIIRCTY